jgi:hypothetical protein
MQDNKLFIRLQSNTDTEIKVLISNKMLLHCIFAWLSFFAS